MRVLTLRVYEVYCANRYTCKLMQLDHMCAVLIPPALPHFSEATSNMSWLREGAVGAETSGEAECRGNPLQGEETRGAEAANGRTREVCAQTCLDGASVTLGGRGGCYRSVGGFLSFKHWAGVKVWWDTGNHRDKAKGFHHVAWWGAEYLSIPSLSTIMEDNLLNNLLQTAYTSELLKYSFDFCGDTT